VVTMKSIQSLNEHSNRPSTRMATIVRTNPRGVRGKSTVHHLPAHIEHEGACPVASYFVVKPVAEEADRVVALLRGRALDGTVASLPAGMAGVVLSEAHFADLSRTSLSGARRIASDDDDDDDDVEENDATTREDWDAALQVDASFQKLTVW
jgi:hypothetical protein